MGRPSGTVTFLFTDIEHSTALWEEHPEAMRQALERHDAILSGAIAGHGGYVFATGGDGFAAAFQRAGDAFATAVEAQQRMTAESWSVDAPIKVRMGLHTGEASERSGDYFGPTLNRGARLMAAAHGGQVLCSGVAASVVTEHLPDGATLRDMGEHRLRDLSEPERLFQVVAPNLPNEFPRVRSLDSFPGNLPVQSTGFVGRELELTTVIEALEAARVVTLCGVGGVGKTRLALQAAAETVPQYADGAWFVELAAVSGPAEVDDAIAGALGVRPRPGVPLRQSILDYLRDKLLLLLLDNCEHLLLPIAQFVENALRQAGGLRVLATSREGLMLSGERVVTVPSLQLPAGEASAEETLASESVRLFVERAQESNSTFAGGVEEAVSMAELCRRLDGIPLAIELAAARVSGMTPAEITSHLDQRFRLLTRGRRAASTRQQTLRNTMDWSYELLESAERLVFNRLAVFAGEFGLDAAEAVAAGDGVDRLDVLDLLARLVEKSLVVADTASGSTRYRLLETMRDYAWERLEEAAQVDAVAQRHLEFFLEFAAQASAGFESPDESVWRARVERDLENLRAALRWAIAADDADAALEEIYSLSNVGPLTSMPFGMVVLEAADLPGAKGHPLRAAAYGCAAMTLIQLGALDEALAQVQAAERELDALGDSAQNRKVACRVRGCLTTPVAYRGDNDAVVELARRGLDDARVTGDRFELMRALILMCATLGDTQRDEAIRVGEEALALVGELRVPTYEAWAPMMLATRLGATNPVRAEELLDRARTAAARIENPWVIRMAEQSLAFVQAAQGEQEAACQTMLSAADLSHRVGDDGGVQSALALLGLLIASIGDEVAALTIGSWVEARGFEPKNLTDNPNYSVFGGTAYLELRDRQSEEHLEALGQRYAGMSIEEILAFVHGLFDPDGSSPAAPVG